MFETIAHQVDLPHELVVEAEAKVGIAQLGERSEFRLARSTHDGIQLAGRTVHFPDACWIRKVNRDGSALMADGYNFIAAGQGGNDSTADGAGCANDENTHREV